MKKTENWKISLEKPKFGQKNWRFSQKNCTNDYNYSALGYTKVSTVSDVSPRTK